jgi:hypothetical protein
MRRLDDIQMGAVYYIYSVIFFICCRELESSIQSTASFLLRVIAEERICRERREERNGIYRRCHPQAIPHQFR